MSSGVKSGQSVGVGDGQLSIENFEYLNRLNELQAEIYTSYLTDAQKSTLNTLTNTITQHLTEMDYSGVEMDIAGKPVPNGRGGYFDHIHEMKDSYKSLKKSKRRLEGSLKNPNLGQNEREILEKAMAAANKHIQRIDALFKPFGGIEQWEKE